MITGLLRRLEDEGMRACVVSSGRAGDLEEELERTRRQGLFDETFFSERLTGFQFHGEESLLDARSLIIVAVPHPHSRLTFVHDGVAIPVMVPPTYIGWEEVDERARRLVEACLPAGEHRLARAPLPLKTLAVHCGLGNYGRNNLCYVPGMGSFVRLVAFYCDLALPEEGWGEHHLMEDCQKCRACQRACPTGAIGTDRLLLHAERCLTFHNEREDPFPGWMDPDWHECLVGCLRCQWICPVNFGLRDWIEPGQSFSEEETSLLLSYEPQSMLPAELMAKLRPLGMADCPSVVRRNLEALVLRGVGR